ncbi:MAG: NPCBM/NEW2 domain-containing protein [Thermoguttaceae bacterium]|nr:NPCBM/NEW2 domain-containing protein [Thermoguttaceae bacterium]
MRRSRALLALAVALAAFFTIQAYAQDNIGHNRPLKCVYFIPSDCEPNADRAERLCRVMKCVQDFYRQEMERNGFGAISFGLEEEKPGELKLYEVRAPGKQEDYGRDSAWAVRDVVAKELAKQGIDVGKEVIVIFQLGLRWEGKKAVEVGPFVGSGAVSYGTAWFYDDPMLDPDNLSSKEPGGYYNGACSVGEFNSHYIGGIAHELGHALTLPHDCELATERPIFGNALMGAGNHTFGNDLRGEGKGAFLTFSEALRLSVVPAINGKVPVRRANDVKLTDLKGTRVSKNVVRFSGRIEAKSPVLGLVFYEDLDSRRSDYDAKTWTVKPDEDGTFEVELTEVAPEPSELRVCAVCDVDTVQLLKVAYNPNGNEGEFGPIEYEFQIQKVAAAYSARDSKTLRTLASEELKSNENLKTLCEELALIIESPETPETPANVDDKSASFDLSNAAFTVQRVGWSRLTRHAFFDGSLLVVGNKAYSSGLCAHAPSELSCDLGKKWKSFRFGYGLEKGGTGSVVFVVYGDGEEIFRSALISDRELHESSVDVSNVQTLKLVVEDGGNGNNSDHSVWIEPKLLR